MLLAILFLIINNNNNHYNNFLSNNTVETDGLSCATVCRLQVNVRAPLKCIKTEGPLYEMQQFEFTVANPFSQGELRSLAYKARGPSPQSTYHPLLSILVSSPGHCLHGNKS